jgi:enamine deaminase RidA (YjgF/YER057c/UK114 family)
MSSVIYKNLPGPVGDCLKPSLATTATVPVSPTTSFVYTTGHIGLDLETGNIINSPVENEFEAIFDCLDAALRHAGATLGLRHAFNLVAYLVDSTDEETMMRVFRQRLPGHTPTWTTVVVKEIVVPKMRAEISASGVIFHNGDQ